MISQYAIASGAYSGTPLYMHQSASLDVVALTIADEFGDTVVSRQDAYSPYGEIAASDLFSFNDFNNAVGFKGLFFDRFASSPYETNLAPGERQGVYQNRNRSYSPTLGRFLQRDPNATAAPVIDSIMFNGQTPRLAGTGFDVQSHYSDVMNLYGFVSGNPINGSDPLGLYANDWETDDLIDEVYGHRLYALGAINEGAKWAAIGLNTALSIGSTLLGVDIFESVQLLHSGQGGFSEAMDIVLAMTPVGKIAKIGGRVGKMLKLKRAAKGSLSVADAIKDISKTVGRWKKGYNPNKLAEARVLYPNKVGSEIHHIIPKYLLPPGTDLSKIPTVPVDKAYHQLITNKFRTVWSQKLPGQPKDYPSPEELEEILDAVYRELPLPIR